MNREIKFRAWNKEKEVMCYENEDGSEDYRDGICISNVKMTNAILSNYREYKYIWMQYTGLKDKNGIGIYEGDVIKIDGVNGVALILRESKVASFVITKEGWIYNQYFGGSIDSLDCEIIGNKRENPDLLNNK